MAIIQRNFCELANHVEICRTANIYWAFRKNNLLVLSKRREFSGMIHRLTYQIHNPSNPQQPIHSLRLAPVRIRRKSWWDFFFGIIMSYWILTWMAWWILLKKTMMCYWDMIDVGEMIKLGSSGDVGPCLLISRSFPGLGSEASNAINHTKSS
jgi:hypothetical protein